MIRVLEGQNFTDAKQFVDALNKARLENRHKWIVYVGMVCDRKVEIKTYDHTYLQIFKVDGLNDPPAMDIKVTVWKNYILERLNGHQKS